MVLPDRSDTNFYQNSIHIIKNQPVKDQNINTSRFKAEICTFCILFNTSIYGAIQSTSGIYLILNKIHVSSRKENEYSYILKHMGSHSIAAFFAYGQ